MHPQLPLSFDHADAKTFASFFAGKNALLLDSLQAFVNDPVNDRQLMLWGAQGAGKTHLLNACCHAASAIGFRVAFLPADVITTPRVFDGLEYCNLVCIDDVDRIPRSRELETGLFNLINAIRQNDQRLLFSSGRAPADLSILLPDLRTRLSWGATYLVQQLSVAEVRAALQADAARAGLTIDSFVIDYLLNNFARDVETQLDNLKKLDAASMQTQRRITIPLVRDVLLSATNQPAAPV